MKIQKINNDIDPEMNMSVTCGNNFKRFRSFGLRFMKMITVLEGPPETVGKDVSQYLYHGIKLLISGLPLLMFARSYHLLGMSLYW